MEEQQRTKILTAIVDYYLSSSDFNGLPGRQLQKLITDPETLQSIVKELIADGSIVLILPRFDVNPYILRIGPPDVEEQLREATKFEEGCLYPSKVILEQFVKKSMYEREPYKLELALGNPQLAYKSFDLSILEFYRNDPRYSYDNDDIRGSISYTASETEAKDSDHLFLQTFGFCYDEGLNRGVAVFLCYLADLSPEHQQIWKAKELPGKHLLHPDYYQNSILGNWGTKIGILDAFLLELEVINQMAEAINGQFFFRNSFTKRPREFSFLVRPTLKEFNAFILLLDKMISENINLDFFRGKLPIERDTPRSDGKIVVERKGTISLLEEWLDKNFQVPDRDPLKKMISTFKKVRKMRQKPAHSIDENRFDLQFFHEQRQLILEAYQGIRLLRLIFANHPRAKHIKVPDLLFNGDIWHF